MQILNFRYSKIEHILENDEEKQFLLMQKFDQSKLFQLNVHLYMH